MSDDIKGRRPGRGFVDRSSVFFSLSREMLFWSLGHLFIKCLCFFSQQQPISILPKLRFACLSEKHRNQNKRLCLFFSRPNGTTFEPRTLKNNWELFRNPRDSSSVVNHFWKKKILFREKNISSMLNHCFVFTNTSLLFSPGLSN